MMKKRTVFSILITLTMAASVFNGCGDNRNSADDAPTNDITNEAGSAPENEEALKNNTTEKKQTDSGQKPADPPQEKSTDEKEAKAKPESKDTTPAEAPAKPADTQTKPENNSSSKPASGNDSSRNSGSAPEAKPEAPAHEHVWHEHTATRQEWVPNVVVVDDYQTQQVEVCSNIQCNCGAVLTSAGELEQHSTAHILAGEPDNWRTVPVYEEQQVKVGSHEEDHGHYETVTYVDYYYCDCGATK